MARVAYGRSQTRVSTSSYPDDNTSPVGTNEWNLDPEASGLLGFTKITATLDSNGQLSTKDDSSTFTNESGDSQAKQSTLIEVECNGSNTTDAVVKIDVTDTNENDIVYLFKGTDGDTVTVTSHSGNFSANGQIKSLDGNSITLNDAGKPVSLMRRGNYWFEFGGGGGVANGSITTAKLAADAVDGTKIADNAINSEHYTDASIDTVHIADDQITTPKIAAGAVDTTELADNSVTGAKIALGSDAVGDIMYNNGTDYVRLPKGSANEVLQMGGSNAPEWGAVAATEIAAGAVDTSELAADAVDGTKIADDAINSEHYTDGSIDLAHLSADSVDGTKIADDAINSEHYAAGSIDTAHIADDQVTLGKMAGLARGKIIYGDASGNPAALALGSNGLALKSDGTDLVWGSAGGGASLFSVFSNSTTTSYAGQSGEAQTIGTAVGSLASGSGDRDVYIRKIDTNNEGVFTVIHKNGALVEVQIA